MNIGIDIGFGQFETTFEANIHTAATRKKGQQVLFHWRLLLFIITDR
jgi:hypothetical protein